jgi:N-acetyl sugar amidotransferase
MKVAIIETIHFQYGLTQSELFHDSELHFFVTDTIWKEMLAYRPEFCVGNVHIIKSITANKNEIIAVCNSASLDLLTIGPVFDHFEAILEISKKVPCKKMLTIHNLNYWLHSSYRSLASYKERKIKQAIVKNFDYIAVEDFIYSYVKNFEKKLFNTYNFVYIPFTIFNENLKKKYQKTNNTLKVVLPGYIHKERRRYEKCLEVIKHFALKKSDIIFSFAGHGVEDYGKWVIGELDKLNNIKPGIATYFPFEGELNPDRFLKEMETSDIVLSTSTTEFKALGTTEYIGKTKPTAAIHDMMSFKLPGLLPNSLTIPENLRGSVLNYETSADLIIFFQNLLDHPEELNKLKAQAEINSLHFTAPQIRKNLPFFFTQCKRCVMDNISNPSIFFDNEGYCNYCTNFYIQKDNTGVKDKYDYRNLEKIIEQIKKEKKKNGYDCVVGVSGGVDSAFLIYKLVKLGLRPIAVHYDNGWNSEVATQNIEMLLKKLNVELYTYVNDWEEFKDIQLSFIKAGVIDIELISDHAISATLMNAAIKFNTKYIFLGHNDVTEFILPTNWYHWKHDALNIKSIHRKFGTKPMKTYPLYKFFNEYYHIKYRKTKMILLLNYINYDKSEAEKILSEDCGWKSYGVKHNESIFTRFFQNYILPVKFRVDKRKAHLSSLICSGQISREEAIKVLQEHTWETKQTLDDKAYVLKKLGVTEQEFDKWMKEPPVSHFKFPSYLTRHNKFIVNLKKIAKLKLN